MIIHFLFLRRSCLFLLFFVDALPPPSSNLALTYYHHKCTKSKQNSYNHFFEFHTWIFENVQVVKHMWSNDLLIQNTSKHWLWLCFKTYEIAAPEIAVNLLFRATRRFGQSLQRSSFSSSHSMVTLHFLQSTQFAQQRQKVLTFTVMSPPPDMDIAIQHTRHGAFATGHRSRDALLANTPCPVQRLGSVQSGQDVTTYSSLHNV